MTYVQTVWVVHVPPLRIYDFRRGDVDECVDVIAYPTSKGDGPPMGVRTLRSYLDDSARSQGAVIAKMINCYA